MPQQFYPLCPCCKARGLKLSGNRYCCSYATGYEFLAKTTDKDGKRILRLTFNGFEEGFEVEEIEGQCHDNPDGRDVSGEWGEGRVNE